MEYINVKILPSNVNKRVVKGSKLIDVLCESNMHIEAICAGKGKCGKCRVKLLEGKINKRNQNEMNFFTKEDIENNIILACEAYLIENIIIELNTEIKIVSNKGYIKKSNININPIIQKKFLILPKPTLEDQASDVERIIRELKENLEFDIRLLPKLHDTLLNSNYEITVTIFDSCIIDIEIGDCTEKNYAIAIDLGTTTVAGYLVDLNKNEIISNYSYLNLQKHHGADVISRINYSIENNQNLSTLKKLAVESIDIIIDKLLESKMIDKKDINIINIIGNTVMSHLFIATTPLGIARVPFAPVFNHTIKGNIDFLGLTALDNKTKFMLLPNIGGYVGSDTLGVIISTDILNKDGNYLAIDIGTNCELVLKTNERVLACSTAAGPAFEGANMSCGIRAENGAIYECEINDDIYIKTIENGHAKGICGSGFIDVVAKFIENKLVKKQGRIIDENKLDSNINQNIKKRINKIGNMNEVILSSLDSSENKVSITQLDISNLQLAKGAVMSAIEIMMKEANITDLDKIYLAGAFGSNLNKNSLKKIKMIPDIEDEKIEVVGNAAGSGAIDVLLSKGIYESLSQTAKSIEHIELANHSDFKTKFAKNMMF